MAVPEVCFLSRVKRGSAVPEVCFLSTVRRVLFRDDMFRDERGAV